MKHGLKYFINEEYNFVKPIEAFSNEYLHRTSKYFEGGIIFIICDRKDILTFERKTLDILNMIALHGYLPKGEKLEFMDFDFFLIPKMIIPDVSMIQGVMVEDMSKLDIIEMEVVRNEISKSYDILIQL